MKITENFVLIGISLLLIVVIFYWIDYLVKNNYIKECFQSNQTMMGPEYSHSVDLPLTTTYSCKNFCGPPARCSITGQQCTSDIDCPGCQPYVPPLPPSLIKKVIGNNEAGKLTVGVTPRYSPLTSGYGTRKTVINKNAQPVSPNFGYNTWKDSYLYDENLFKDTYGVPKLQYLPDYSPRQTITGIYITDGPYPSNATLK